MGTGTQGATGEDMAVMPDAEHVGSCQWGFGLAAPPCHWQQGTPKAKGWGN